jgi:hypothetical protein
VLFRDRDLLLRLAAAGLPAPSGYLLTRQLTPILGGSRHAHVERVVAARALEMLGDRELAEAAGRGFASAIACDDLDGLTGALWPRAFRLAALTIEGAHQLPADRPRDLRDLSRERRHPHLRRARRARIPTGNSRRRTRELAEPLPARDRRRARRAPPPRARRRLVPGRSDDPSRGDPEPRPAPRCGRRSGDRDRRRAGIPRGA